MPTEQQRVNGNLCGDNTKSKDLTLLPLWIVEEECKREQISLNELKGGGRRRKISGLRSTIAKRGRDELGLSLAEIARHVGVNTSSIRKAILRLEEA